MFPWRNICSDTLPNFKRVFILSLSNYITLVVGSGEALEVFFFKIGKQQTLQELYAYVLLI